MVYLLSIHKHYKHHSLCEHRLSSIPIKVQQLAVASIILEQKQFERNKIGNLILKAA